MYQKLKANTIKSAMRPNTWPKHLKQLPRYSTFKTGAIVLLALIDHPRGIDFNELKELTGRSRKTICRILAVWEEIGVPIYSEWNGEHKLIYMIIRSWGEKFKEKLNH